VRDVRYMILEDSENRITEREDNQNSSQSCLTKFPIHKLWPVVFDIQNDDGTQPIPRNANDCE
jgi:hypothetical protein